MSDLKKILKEEYDKKKLNITPKLLMEMIEQVMLAEATMTRKDFATSDTSRGITLFKQMVANGDEFLLSDGSRVVIVDDSIVRGTNIKKLVDFARNKGGASEVHVRISSPPYMHSCYLGVDTKKESELIAHNRSIPEIEKFIGADSLAYLSKEGMLSNPYLKDKGHCTYCFDGLVQIERD